MNKLLLFSTSSEISHYERFAQKCGINLCTLDCFLDTHHLSTSPYVSERIVVKSHRFDVQRAIAQQNAASILIDACENTMRAALVVQAARDADVPFIAVVTSEENQQSVFRRLGAHAVIVAKTGQQTFQRLHKGKLMKSLRANKQKFWSRKFIRTGRAWVGSIQGEEVV